MVFSPTLSHVVLVITAGVLFYAALTDLNHFKIRNELISSWLGCLLYTLCCPAEGHEGQRLCRTRDHDQIICGIVTEFIGSGCPANRDPVRHPNVFYGRLRSRRRVDRQQPHGALGRRQPGLWVLNASPKILGLHAVYGLKRCARHAYPLVDVIVCIEPVFTPSSPGSLVIFSITHV
jgi:hypothetical protein